jgi:hypothetical protein
VVRRSLFSNPRKCFGDNSKDTEKEGKRKVWRAENETMCAEKGRYCCNIR